MIYQSETGGKLENLRTTCTHKRVFDYHRNNYCVENLAIIIVGNVDAEQVFVALQTVEPILLSKVFCFCVCFISLDGNTIAYVISM